MGREPEVAVADTTWVFRVMIILIIIIVVY